MANIKARRKLADLYKKGVEVRFGKDANDQTYGKVGPFVDDEGNAILPAEDEVSIWVQPPSPLQREQALRDAQASRSRALVRAHRDQDSPEYLTAMSFLVEMDDETLIDYVLIADTESRRQDAMREVLGMKEWEDMLSYTDAMRQFDEMTEEEREASEEYAAMMELDRKFGDQVAARELELREAAEDVLKMFGRAEVEKRALDKRSAVAASQSFMAEYERQMMFYAAREMDDHGVLFFESARELAETEDEIRVTLGEALEQFIDDVGEAKNSLGAVAGSPQSAPPSEQETSEASTPQDATA